MSAEEIAAILDEPQLKRLSGAILALDLKYVAAAQEAPAAIRALAARVRELERALRGAHALLWANASTPAARIENETRALEMIDAALAPTQRDAP